MPICSRSVRRTTSIGSTNSARSGRSSTSSLMRASNFNAPTTPTLRPKLRKVPRRSLSMAMAFDSSSLRWVSSILAAQRLHMHWAIKSRPHHLRDATRIVAVGLVDLRLQHRPHVPRLDADHRQACLGKRAKKPLRQWTCFQSYPLEAIERVRHYRQQSFRLARYLRFPYQPTRVIDYADAGLLDRYVQSSKIIHAALLLLMLEAVPTDLVSPSA